MWNNPQGNQPNSITVNQIGMPMQNDDGFPIPQSRNKQQPHYQKPYKVRPQQQFLKVLDTMPMPSPQHIRKISPEQLAMHSSLESAWVSLNGVVYDVTLYMNYHPGGLELARGCGKECSQLFNQYHPWVNAQYLLEKFKIGHLVSNSGPSQKHLAV